MKDLVNKPQQQYEALFDTMKNTIKPIEGKIVPEADDNMKNELTIKCHLLNKMFEIGRPISARIS